MMDKTIPKNIQQLVWTKPSGLNLEKDKTSIIHRVLRFGTLDDIGWLLKTYGNQEVKETFLIKPVNIYSKPSFNFVKNTILKINQSVADETKYIQSFY